MENNQEIKVGSKVMWLEHNGYVPYTCYGSGTIVSETKTEFKTDNGYRIKKQYLTLVGHSQYCYGRVELFNEKEYTENFLIPQQRYNTILFIEKHIFSFIKQCTDEELSKLKDDIKARLRIANKEK